MLYGMVTRTAPASTPNALHQRRWRERQRNPIRSVSHVEYERDAVLRALVHTGRLKDYHRHRIQHALSLVIAEWAAKVNKYSHTQAIANAIMRLSKSDGNRCDA